MKEIKRGSFILMEYDNGYYAVDYSDESVGYTIIMSQDKQEVEKKYQECVTMK